MITGSTSSSSRKAASHFPNQLEGSPSEPDPKIGSVTRVVMPWATTPQMAGGNQFLKHYIKCKIKRPHHTAACIIVPIFPNQNNKFPESEWYDMLKNMELIRVYPAGSLSSATSTPQGLIPVNTNKWPVHIYYNQSSPANTQARSFEHLSQNTP